MQVKCIAAMLFCLVITLFFSSSPVLASTSHGGSGGSHEVEDIDPSHGGSGGNHGEDTDPSHGGGGGNHKTSVISIKDLVQPYVLIWEWSKTAIIRIDVYTFSFADVFIFVLLLVVFCWFLHYCIYYL